MLLSNELSTTGLHNPRTWELRGIIMNEDRHETPMNCKLHQFVITKARKQGIAMKSKMLDANVSACVLQLKAPKEVTRVRNKSKQNNKIPGTCKSDQ